MNPTLYQTLPIIAIIGFLAVGFFIAMRTPATTIRGLWIAPAALGCLFLAWTLYAVLRGGLLGFWPEHVRRGAWGNQIWFDLLLSLGVAFGLLAPRAKALGMRVLPWFALIVCTGSIGLLWMLARYLLLSERASDHSSVVAQP